MPLNQTFAQALYSPEKQFKAPEARRAALDALVEAGEDISRFRQAILDHKDFWQGIAGLDLNGQGDTDAFIDGADTNYNPQYFYHNARLVRARERLAGNDAVTERMATCTPANLAQLLADEAVKDVVGDWGATPHPATLGQLHQLSQHALLLAKVRAATPAEVNNLLCAATPEAFLSAAKNIGYSGPLPQGFPEVMREVAAHYFLTGLSPNDVIDIGNQTLAQANFFQALQATRNEWGGLIYALNDGGYSERYLHQQLGLRYLNECPINDAQLSQLVACNTVDAFKTTLGDVIEDSAGHFKNNVVAPATFELLREQAALRLLGRLLQTCQDVPAMEALRTADTPEAIRAALEQYPSLGFSGEASLSVREAIATHRAAPELVRRLNPLLAARKIETADFNTPEGKTLLTGILEAVDGKTAASMLKMDGAMLSEGVKTRALQRALTCFLEQASESTVKALVTHTGFGPSAYADFLHSQLFPENTNPELKRYLQQYCNEPAHENHLRQQAANACIWRYADSLSDEVLNVFADNDDDDALDLARTAIFPGAPEAVIQSPEFSRLALAQMSVRAARQQNKDKLLRFANTLDVEDVESNRALSALPDDKKNALRIQVTEILLSKEPLSRDLEVLANATSTDARKGALKKLGLLDTVVDAFSDADTATFKTLARERLNGLRLESVSRFGAAARPQLLALVEKIPEAERVAFWDDKKALKALVDARFPEDVKRVRLAFSAATSAEIDAVCDENLRLYRLSYIHNAPLAGVLASLGLGLDSQTCVQVNDIIHNAMWNDDTAFESTATALHRTCGQPGTLDAFKAALAVEREVIHAQHLYNQAGRNIYHQPRTSELDKRILDFFLGLPKTADLDDVKTGPGSLWDANGGLLVLFKNAKTLSELHAEVDKASWKGVLPPSWKDELTRARFEDFKRYERHEKLRGAHYQQEIQVLNERLQEMQTRQEAFAKSAKPLQYFNQFHPAYAFMPVFHGKARENARAMQSHFETLDADCDTIVTNLRLQIEQLENIRDSLPDAGGMSRDRQKALNKLFQDVQARESRARQLLAFYERVQRSLRGDPRSSNVVERKGVMQQLAELESGKRSTMVFVNCTEKDVPDSPEALKTLAGAPPGAAPLTSLSVNSGPFDFGEAKPLADGMLREYTLASVASPSLEGRYAEQRAAAGVMPQTGDVVNHVTLTVTHFPKAGPRVTDEALHEARVEFAMTMASQMLASIDWTPSEHRPLYLKGSNAEEQKYLWTALRILGQNTPGRKFDEKAIKVVGPFKPSSEMGMFSYFSSTKKKFEAVMKPEDAERMEKYEAYKEGMSSPKRQESIKKALEAFTGRALQAVEDAKDENAKNNPGSGA
ncbi:hypothetical protein E3226_008895 [Legionella geestiana]|uniref:hypothetical protein n=1 Tax=Legionella geestiana TaxID=45065 RepID=UPI0010929577|nr:hypothetical protein [Legionella geestiana]QDQ40496.1 hypothetical protein E3226_008895 [Legionella geestiana]